MSMEMNKALDLLREIRPSIPKEALELWCKDRDAFLASHPAVEQAGGDERAAFEAAFAAMGRPVCRADYDQDAYGTPFDDGGWTGWQARAALAQPSPDHAVQAHDIPMLIASEHANPDYAMGWNDCRAKIIGASSAAQAEQAEAERPEVVARVVHSNPVVLGQCGPLNANDELMTVAQHAASVARWAEMFNRVEQQRDAALARVAELTATRNRYGVDAHYFNKNLQRILRDFENFTTDELARSLIILAKVADEKVVAQAQHSVPGDIMRDAQRYRWLRDQQFYFSFSTENSDAGISSCTAGMSSRFKNLSWVDAAIDSAIAAAPAQGGE
ncbi:hypothetical protein N0430_26270 [Pseudomonas aeruginosa]|nr:hypothetical protein [Pseudomonas aeruginosa]MCT1206929.1 hypothetical protein [Pseudomonas aeruginosa]